MGCHIYNNFISLSCLLLALDSKRRRIYLPRDKRKKDQPTGVEMK